MNIASIASIPDRVRSLQETINSILPQVDRVLVHLNGYAQVPTFLHNDRIDVRLDSRGGGAREKLHFEPLPGVFYVTCDDDLVYPRNYVERLGVAARSFFGVVCVHGVRIRQPFVRYRDSIEIFHFRDHQFAPARVHLPGTGTMGFFGGEFSIPSFHEPNMVDVELGVHLHREGVPITCIAHPANWIRQIPQPRGSSIFDSVSKGEDDKQSNMLRGVVWPS